MSSKPKAEEEEGGESAPLWIISFADMISLLMAFFVMLSTFSDFGPKEVKQLHGVLQVAMFESGSFFQKTSEQSGIAPNISAANATSQGSSVPTLEKTASLDTIEQTNPITFRDYRVFQSLSSDMFISNGVTLSPRGRAFLETFADFWKSAPCRIIITERGANKNDKISIQRSVAAIEYLDRLGVKSEWCSVSGRGAMPQSYFSEARIFEIWLADGSICP
jgi:flagellar motor protein MotB